MQALANSLNRLRPVAPVLIRLIVGIVFFWHGIDKFNTGISNVEGAFDGWGVPLPGVTAPLTAIIEVVAGAALIVGVATRLAALVLAAVMVGAIVFVKAENGLIGAGSAELDLALIAAMVALVAWGAGRWSLDEALGWEPADR